MNKTVVTIVVLLILGLLLFFYLDDREADDVGLETEDQVDSEVLEDEAGVDGDSDEIDETDEAATRMRLESAVVIEPELGVEVPLEGGEGSFDAGGIVATEGFAVLGNEFTVVDIEGQSYVLAHVSFNTGGSGVFDYLVSLQDTGSEFEQVDAVSLGDQIIVESIEAESVAESSAQVTVEILTRAEGESLSADPTVSETLEFTVTAEGEIE